MANRYSATAALLSIMLLAGCGPGATRTSTPPTAAPAAASTAPAPPTDAPVPPTAAPPPANTPVPLAIKPRQPPPPGALRITIVFDNTAYDPRLRTSWGFAALIEYRGHTLLFDTGGDPDILMDNMDLLGIDPLAIEAIALSHIHGDHVDGLPGLAARGLHAPVYVPPSFPHSFRARFGGQFELIDVTPGQELSDGILTTGEMMHPDVRIYEQSLVISTTQGLVVVTGCAHPGIVEIVTRAREMGAVHLVLGGFHLGNKSRSEIQTILSDFRRLGVEQAGPTHCTGEMAIAMLAEAYGDDFVPAGVGRIIVIE